MELDELTTLEINGISVDDLEINGDIVWTKPTV